MSFREKTAWLTLIAIIVVSLMFWHHAPPTFEASTHHWAMKALWVSLGTYLVIEVVGFLVLRFRNAREARVPRDERERLIDLKATRVAYHAYVLGSFGGMYLMLHMVGAGPGTIGLVVVVAFVFSQLARHAARIVYYRRDS